MVEADVTGVRGRTVVCGWRRSTANASQIPPLRSAEFIPMAIGGRDDEGDARLAIAQEIRHPELACPEQR